MILKKGKTSDLGKRPWGEGEEGHRMAHEKGEGKRGVALFSLQEGPSESRMTSGGNIGAWSSSEVIKLGIEEMGMVGGLDSERHRRVREVRNS